MAVVAERYCGNRPVAVILAFEKQLFEVEVKLGRVAASVRTTSPPFDCRGITPARITFRDAENTL